MSPDELFEAWKRRRSDSEIPAGFAQRVQEAVRHQSPPTARKRLALLRVVVGTAAVAACLFRIAATLSLFLEGGRP